jgi:hypothetical protein
VYIGPVKDGDRPIAQTVGGCDPYDFVISANIHRRHLTAEQKRELIGNLLKANPEKSDRRIAETVKASPTTVGDVRSKMEATGDVSKLDTRRDTKGREQPARKGWSRERFMRHRARKREPQKPEVEVESFLNPLIVAWDNASEKQRRDLVWERKIEIMKVQQLIGRGAFDIQGSDHDGLDIPDYLRRDVKAGAAR